MKVGWLHNWIIASLLLGILPMTAARSQYVSAPLPLPAGATNANAISITHGEIAGYATINSLPHALLWNGFDSTWIDLDPGMYGSYLTGNYGFTECGYNAASQYIYYYGGGRGGRIHKAVVNLYHAAIWKGGGSSYADLNPAGAALSYALAIYGNREAGAAVFAGPPLYSGPEYAYVWTSTAASAVNIDNGYTWTQANCIGPNNVGGIGSASLGANPHAILWQGTAYTIVDLHPTAFPAYSSSITCLDDSRNQQGGYLYIYDPTTGGYLYTAYLWNGNAASAVSLAPAGSTSSKVLAMYGGYQVGSAIIGGVNHAMVWKGTAASAVDLGPGVATGIDTNGDIVGISTATGVPIAVIWYKPAIPHITSSQTPAPNSYGWCNTPVTIQIQSPFSTGTPRINYRWDSSAITTVSGTNTTITDSTQGTHFLTVSATDGASTTAPEVITVNVDTVAPSTTANLAAGAFTLKASDSASGVKATYYILDGGAATTYTGPVSVTNVTHSLQFWSVDKAGNAEAVHAVTLPIEPPTLISITPTSVATGSADTTVTLKGADFESSSVVLWNGTPLTTTYVSTTTLTAVIPAADLVNASTDSISVQNPNPNGGISGTLPFSVIEN